MPEAAATTYSQAQLTKYQSLIRLATRWLFSGDVIERIDAAAADDVAVVSGAPKKRKAKISEKDMAVVIMDALSYHEGWVSEENFAQKIQLGGKQVRKMLQFLQKQGFVVREHRRERKQGNKVESVAEQEQVLAEARTATYVSIDYPRFFDMLRLRIHLAKRQATDRIDDGSTVEAFACCPRDASEPVCGKKYTSFDMLDLEMSHDGFYTCDTCDNGIVAPDDVLSQSEPNGITRIKRAKYRREAATVQRNALWTAVKPLDEQIQTLDKVDPPDFGSFTDWSSMRQAMLKSGKMTARETTGRGGRAQGHLDYGIDGPLSGDIGVSVEVNTGTEQPAGGVMVSVAPPKDPKQSLPYFMQQAGASNAGPSNEQAAAGTQAGGEQAAAEEAQKQEEYLAEFRKQYEAQINALNAQRAAAEEAAAKAKKEEPVVKQEVQEVADTADGIPEEAGTQGDGGDMEWEDGGDVEWEDT